MLQLWGLAFFFQLYTDVEGNYITNLPLSSVDVLCMKRRLTSVALTYSMVVTEERLTALAQGSGKQKIVIVIIIQDSKLLNRHSKAKCREPVYSWGLHWVRGVGLSKGSAEEAQMGLPKGQSGCWGRFCLGKSGMNAIHHKDYHTNSTLQTLHHKHNISYPTAASEGWWGHCY